MKIITTLAAAVAAAVALAGCATMPGFGMGYGGYGTPNRTYPESANILTPQQAQQVQHVHLGTVIAVQPVRIDASRMATGTGMALGAAGGGLLGSQIGGGKGKTLATIAGALGGAVAGDQIASHTRTVAGLQITVRLDGTKYMPGQIVAITQDSDVPLAVGERVEVIGGGYGQVARVEPLPAAAPVRR